MQGSSAKMDSNTSATITFAGFLAGKHFMSIAGLAGLYKRTENPTDPKQDVSSDIEDSQMLPLHPCVYCMVRLGLLESVKIIIIIIMIRLGLHWQVPLWC